MLVWVELVAVLTGVESLETVLLECAHQDSLSHPQTIIKRLQLLVGAQLVLGNNGEGAVQVVDTVEEVLGESLKSEVLCCLDFTLCLLLKVAVLGDLTLPLVLYSGLSIMRKLWR